MDLLLTFMSIPKHNKPNTMYNNIILYIEIDFWNVENRPKFILMFSLIYCLFENCNQ